MRISNWAALSLRRGTKQIEKNFFETFNGTLSRGFALFLAGFAFLNVIGNLRSPGFDANLWWIDLRRIPDWCASGLLLVSAFSLVCFAIRPAQAAWRRYLTISCTALLAIATSSNAVQFYILTLRGDISAGVPIPFSLFVCIALGMIIFANLRRNQPEDFSRAIVVVGNRPPAISPALLSKGCNQKPLTEMLHIANKKLFPVLMVCGACAAIFPFAQMLFFGKTDYRRPADIAVVLGARVYADGHPSDALADRVRTACNLYRNGTVKKLLFSGGPGDGPIHETEGMKRMAVQLGVKPEDILLDAHGLNTQATVKNTGAAFQQLHASRILVVSHFYHLPRIKLAYHREGWEVYTVPAKESYLLRQIPFNMAREVAALWVYYFRPLAKYDQSLSKLGNSAKQEITENTAA
jgi:vancomycin permeability regulator SanA